MGRLAKESIRLVRTSSVSVGVGRIGHRLVKDSFCIRTASVFKAECGDNEEEFDSMDDKLGIESKCVVTAFSFCFDLNCSDIVEKVSWLDDKIVGESTRVGTDFLFLSELNCKDGDVIMRCCDGELAVESTSVLKALDTISECKVCLNVVSFLGVGLSC